MSVAATLLGGTVFGLALAAPPGPMNAVVATESVLRGWRAGFRAGLGAMTADVCFFVLALVGLVASVQRSPDPRTALFAGGGLSTLYFAYDAVGNARSFVEDDVDEGKRFRKVRRVVLWLVAFPAALVSARRRVEAVAPLVAWLSGAVLAESGVLFLAEAATRL